MAIDQLLRWNPKIRFLEVKFILFLIDIQLVLCQIKNIFQGDFLHWFYREVCEF